MKEEKNKKWKVVFSEEVLRKFKDIPDNVAEEFEKIIKGFKTGKLDPTKIGQPVDWIELNVKLKCPICKNEDVEWLLDRNTKEVDFHCLKCNESFWMTIDEYRNAIDKNPDCIIHNS